MHYNNFGDGQSQIFFIQIIKFVHIAIPIVAFLCLNCLKLKKVDTYTSTNIKYTRGFWHFFNEASLVFWIETSRNFQLSTRIQVHFTTIEKTACECVYLCGRN